MAEHRPPKYRNPDQPSETWAGRGKQPRWLVAQLRSGKRIDDFKIKKAANRR
jgi:DNA-binding protein H-NS